MERVGRRALLRGAATLPVALGGLAGAAGLVGLSGCSAGPPPVPERFRLATGPAGAVYREIGTAYAGVLDEAWGARVVDVLHTDAAVENARMLVAGEAEIGLVNVDVAAEHPDELRALARVFDSVLHLVVTVDSDVRSLADLEGRVVAAGLEESGTRFVLERMLAHAGVRAEIRTMSQADSVAALLDGEVEVVASLTGMPTPAVTDLADAALPTRLADLTADLPGFVAAYPLSYLSVVIPTTMYPPMPSAAAVAVPTLLVAPTSTSDDVVRFCVEVLFDRAADLSAVRPEASQINPRTGAATTPIALHPAARDWFRDHKP
ncbi:TAXI family TRAP transporter solute-binding subunit [Nocardioides zeae]|uniref:TAXI family TRAP transporter solute-binding subunit n=1 Tax=Nocardioides imazamoxiresistens TaxID=3231893 RepID=A0ABU3PVP2_9ACTN|nr:TAXI family TRAP transporter solute-binding subunit [Nocardioides zeae]MDT9592887.1 TAXI family TRAP transporter solute-binding subunit [Nocardioides zeae]